MRRPHVYERSAPRTSRNAYHEPVGDRALAARDLAGMLHGLLTKAEAAGLPALADLIHRAVEEADLQAKTYPSSIPPAAAHCGDDRPSSSDVEGLMRVLDASIIVAPPDA